MKRFLLTILVSMASVLGFAQTGTYYTPVVQGSCTVGDGAKFVWTPSNQGGGSSLARRKTDAQSPSTSVDATAISVDYSTTNYIETETAMSASEFSLTNVTSDYDPVITIAKASDYDADNSVLHYTVTFTYMSMPEDGKFYRIKEREGAAFAGYCMTIKSGGVSLTTQKPGTGTSNTIFRFNTVDATTGTVTIQAANGKYIQAYVKDNQIIALGDDAVNYTIGYVEDGIYTFGATASTSANKYLHYNDNDKVVGWTSTAKPSQWELEEVTFEDFIAEAQALSDDWKTGRVVSYATADAKTTLDAAITTAKAVATPAISDFNTLSDAIATFRTTLAELSTSKYYQLISGYTTFNEKHCAYVNGTNMNYEVLPDAATKSTIFKFTAVTDEDTKTLTYSSTDYQTYNISEYVSDLQITQAAYGSTYTVSASGTAIALIPYTGVTGGFALRSQDNDHTMTIGAAGNFPAADATTGVISTWNTIPQTNYPNSWYIAEVTVADAKALLKAEIDDLNSKYLNSSNYTTNSKTTLQGYVTTATEAYNSTTATAEENYLDALKTLMTNEATGIEALEEKFASTGIFTITNYGTNTISLYYNGTNGYAAAGTTPETLTDNYKWAIYTVDGKTYLYNLGAGTFLHEIAGWGASNNWQLSNINICDINIDDSNDGYVLLRASNCTGGYDYLHYSTSYTYGTTNWEKSEDNSKWTITTLTGETLTSDQQTAIAADFTGDRLTARTEAYQPYVDNSANIGKVGYLKNTSLLHDVEFAISKVSSDYSTAIATVVKVANVVLPTTGSYYRIKDKGQSRYAQFDEGASDKIKAQVVTASTENQVFKFESTTGGWKIQTTSGKYFQHMRYWNAIATTSGSDYEIYEIGLGSNYGTLTLHQTIDGGWDSEEYLRENSNGDSNNGYVVTGGCTDANGQWYFEAATEDIYPAKHYGMPLAGQTVTYTPTDTYAGAKTVLVDLGYYVGTPAGTYEATTGGMVTEAAASTDATNKIVKVLNSATGGPYILMSNFSKIATSSYTGENKVVMSGATSPLTWEKVDYYSKAALATATDNANFWTFVTGTDGVKMQNAKTGAYIGAAGDDGNYTTVTSADDALEFNVECLADGHYKFVVTGTTNALHGRAMDEYFSNGSYADYNKIMQASGYGLNLASDWGIYTAADMATTVEAKREAAITAFTSGTAYSNYSAENNTKLFYLTESGKTSLDEAIGAIRTDAATLTEVTALRNLVKNGALFNLPTTGRYLVKNHYTGNYLTSYAMLVNTTGYSYYSVWDVYKKGVTSSAVDASDNIVDTWEDGAEASWTTDGCLYNFKNEGNAYVMLPMSPGTTESGVKKFATGSGWIGFDTSATPYCYTMSDTKADLVFEPTGDGYAKFRASGDDYYAYIDCAGNVTGRARGTLDETLKSGVPSVGSDIWEFVPLNSATEESEMFYTQTFKNKSGYLGGPITLYNTSSIKELQDVNDAITADTKLIAEKTSNATFAIGDNSNVVYYQAICQLIRNLSDANRLSDATVVGKKLFLENTSRPSYKARAVAESVTTDTNHPFGYIFRSSANEVSDVNTLGQWAFEAILSSDADNSAYAGKGFYMKNLGTSNETDKDYVYLSRNTIDSSHGEALTTKTNSEKAILYYQEVVPGIYLFYDVTRKENATSNSNKYYMTITGSSDSYKIHYYYSKELSSHFKLYAYTELTVDPVEKMGTDEKPATITNTYPVVADDGTVSRSTKTASYTSFTTFSNTTNNTTAVPTSGQYQIFYAANARFNTDVVSGDATDGRLRVTLKTAPIVDGAYLMQGGEGYIVLTDGSGTFKPAESITKVYKEITSGSTADVSKADVLVPTSGLAITSDNWSQYYVLGYKSTSTQIGTWHATPVYGTGLGFYHPAVGDEITDQKALIPASVFGTVDLSNYKPNTKENPYSTNEEKAAAAREIMLSGMGWQIDFEDEEGNVTAIADVDPDGTIHMRENIYDLSGRKLSEPKSGINIINGKTVIVK